MPDRFAGFSPKAFTFLRQLKKNNDRAWFQPRKAIFLELLRNPMLELAEQINQQLRSFAVDHVTDPKKAVHRIYRDTRFSKDKTPYKSRVSAMFPRAGLGKEAGAGFYFSLSVDGLRIASGMFRPEPEELRFIRRRIADDARPITKLLNDKTVARKLGPCQGDMAARVPKDFAADHPAAPLLRRKEFYFACLLAPETVFKPTVLKHIVDRFRAAGPLVSYLNQLALERVEVDSEDVRPQRPVPMF